MLSCEHFGSETTKADVVFVVSDPFTGTSLCSPNTKRNMLSLLQKAVMYEMLNSEGLLPIASKVPIAT